MPIPLKKTLDIIVLIIRIVGFASASYSILQFFSVNNPNQIEVTHDDIYLHGIPLVRILSSFLIIAIASLIESVRNFLPKRWLLPTES
ncbi:MAG: hypothetical protein ACREAD_05350 [Nitrosopumilaceae archaeon]